MDLIVTAVTVFIVLTLGYCQGNLLSQIGLIKNTPTVRVSVCVCSDAVSVTAGGWEVLLAACRQMMNNINQEATAEETTTSTPSALTTGKAYVYRGCYGDDRNRVLPHENIVDNKYMTIDMCRNHCIQNGYSFFGLEDGQECFCGNLIKSGYAIMSDNQCDLTCSGDPTKTCGGWWRMAIYQVV